jgi:molybdate transport system substrate-binding protein
MRLFLALVLLLGLAAPARAQARPVVVFAAASLKDALDEIAAGWRRSGNAVAISYAASSALARQIGAGAPADIFISADAEWMDWAVARNLVQADTRRDLAGNRLVLVAPADSKATVEIAPGFDLAGALGSGRLAMADAGAVPAGRYARATLTALGAWSSVEARVAQAENVRAALLLVARGEAPLGIVYASDAVAERRVRTVAMFPPHTHPPIVYPAAATATASPAAARFMVALQTAEARAVLQRWGFTPLG